MRHKAKKSSLEVGLVSEWNDDHIADFEDKLIQEWSFSSTSLSNDLTKIEANNGAVNIGMSSNHNFCNLISSTTANGLAVLELGEGDVTNKLDLPVFTTAIKLETSDKIEFGFFVHANAPFTANQKGAYFRISGGKVYAVTGNGTNETITEIGEVNTYEQYKIEFTSTDVRFYVGDIRTIDATHTTNIPTDNLTIKFSVKTNGGVSQIARVDGFALQRLRKR